MNKQILFLLIFLKIIFPCFSGGPHELEEGFYYIWADAKVYDKPSFSGNIINNVKFNTRVEVLNLASDSEEEIIDDWRGSDYWYKVRVNNFMGYIFGRYFTHEIIEHIDQYGNEYNLYIHYAGNSSINGSHFNTNSIKMLINNKEISLVFPELHFSDIIYIENYSTNHEYSYYIYELTYFKNVFIFPIHHNDGHGAFRFTFNNFGVDQLLIYHKWNIKLGATYESSLLLKWDNENNIYYEIENKSEELNYEFDIDEESEQYLNNKSNQRNINENLNNNEPSYTHVRIKPVNITLTDRIVNIIFSNKYILFSLIFLLIGIFIFTLYIRKRK